MEYCHKRTYPIRWTDCDFKDEVKPSALLSLAQEAAGTSGDELGFGYDDLKPMGLGFVIVSTYCEILMPPVREDCYTVETWPLPPRHVFFERDYRITGGSGMVAALASRWCLVDFESFELRYPNALGRVHDECPYRREKSVEVPNWKIEKLFGAGEEVYRKRVGSSLCDHYLHANNTHYADFFMSCFTMDELRSRRLKAFQINYVKQAKEGDELAFYRLDRGSESILEARRDGETIAQFKAVFSSDGGENEA